VRLDPRSKSATLTYGCRPEELGRYRPIFVTCDVTRMADPTAAEDACASVLDDFR